MHNAQLSLIKGIEKMHWLTESEMDILEQEAKMHRRYSNIGFKIISVTLEKIIIRVYQGRSLSENYADRKRLVEIGKEMFGPLTNGRILNIGPAPFQFTEFVMIHNENDLKTVVDNAFEKRRDFVDFINQFGFDFSETVLSNHISGRKELTEWHKMAYSFALSFSKFKDKKYISGVASGSSSILGVLTGHEIQSISVKKTRG